MEAVKDSFVKEAYWKSCVMTEIQTQIVSLGMCPRCSCRLKKISMTENMSFNGCKRCGHIWVL